MTSILLEKVNQLKIANLEAEERYITNNISWDEYERLLAEIGESCAYRLTYLEETLEIMSPSRRHKISAENISRLLDVYFEEKRIPFWSLGSTTLRKKEQKAGKEPDKSYCIGTDKEFPDLAIEVVMTSGGIDKLKVYQRLGIKEVWFWQDDQVLIYCLEGDKYQLMKKSQLLPDLDIDLMVQYINHTNPLEVLIEFRQKIRAQINE